MAQDRHQGVDGGPVKAFRRRHPKRRGSSPELVQEVPQNNKGSVHVLVVRAFRIREPYPSPVSVGSSLVGCHARAGGRRCLNCSARCTRAMRWGQVPWYGVTGHCCVCGRRAVWVLERVAVRALPTILLNPHHRPCVVKLDHVMVASSAYPFGFSVVCSVRLPYGPRLSTIFTE